MQRLALAHIHAEEEIELKINQNSDFSPFFVTEMQKIHEALYSKLDKEDRTIEKNLVVTPGAWRNVDVAVGHHIPPPHASINAFLQRYEQFIRPQHLR